MRYILIGLVTLFICAVFFAPASLLEKGLESSTELSISDTRGSLWYGSALLSMPGKVQVFAPGRLEWAFIPQALFSLCLSYDVELLSETYAFNGRVCRSKDTIEISGDLDLHSSLLNELLANYDMQVTGVLQMSAFRLAFRPDSLSATRLPVIEDLSAQMYWSGGSVQYRLSGLNHALNLPPMQGDLGLENGSPNMRVYEQSVKGGNSEQKARIPLILGDLDQNGWISIGITKKFTKLLKQPWPGNVPDHAVVLEVQEKLL